MIRERTTESPSAKPWDCCYVSEGSNFRRAPHFCLECDCVAQLIHTRFCCSHPGHILEHSEDDTKSLFAIIKVHRPPPSSFFLLFMSRVLLFGRAPAEKKKKKGLTAPLFCVCLCDYRSSVTSCFSEELTRRSSNRAGRASLSSRSPWKTGWVQKLRIEKKSKKAQQGRWLLSVLVSQ